MAQAIRHQVAGSSIDIALLLERRLSVGTGEASLEFLGMRLAPKSALLFNATFSLMSGLLLVISPGTVGTWLGVSIDGWFRLLGVVLVSHAALIAGLLSSLGVDRAVRINLLMIAPYPLVMLGLVVFGKVTSNLGRGLVLADGAIITAVVASHVIALRSARPSEVPVEEEHDRHGV